MPERFKPAHGTPARLAAALTARYAAPRSIAPRSPTNTSASSAALRALRSFQSAVARTGASGKSRRPKRLLPQSPLALISDPLAENTGDGSGHGMARVSVISRVHSHDHKMRRVSRDRGTGFRDRIRDADDDEGRQRCRWWPRTVSGDRSTIPGRRPDYWSDCSRTPQRRPSPEPAPGSRAGQQRRPVPQPDYPSGDIPERWPTRRALLSVAAYDRYGTAEEKP